MVSQNPFFILNKAAQICGGWPGLQERLGASRQALWYWRTGKRVPNSTTILKCLQIIERAAKAAEDFS